MESTLSDGDIVFVKKF
ncbi:MAG: hypothetical protein J6583_12640 [Gilliamella sp.]|nr:hypothetical protein [Lactobacillus sp.]MCO6548602.1 hypothetical protein [Gilliamella sp.]